jgi:hypothetical protein
MATPKDSPRTGLRVSFRGGPLVPLVGVCVGVVALTAAVTLGGEDSSSNTGNTGNGGVAALSTTGPAQLPPTNNCVLRVDGTPRAISAVDARTLTQVAAVGWQVKAPEEMVARVLDVATAKPGKTPSVTDALDLFTREDSTVPSGDSVAELRALAEPGGLTCAFPAPAAATEKRGRSGLTPRADAMRQSIVDAFGKLTMSSFGPKAKDNPAGAAGRALSVAVPDTFTPEANAGWVIAHWLTARGADLKLDTVAFDDQVWSPTSGWQAATPGSAKVAPVRDGRLFVSVTAGTAAKDSKSSAKKSKKKS